MAASRFEAQIRFLTDDDEVEQPPVRAIVIDRGDEMVIEIPVQPDSTAAYTVCGRKTLGYYFAGTNERTDPAIPVVARWALLGDVYVGIWIEQTVEWLISFRRPKTTAAAPLAFTGKR